MTIIPRDIMIALKCRRRNVGRQLLSAVVLMGATLSFLHLAYVLNGTPETPDTAARLEAKIFVPRTKRRDAKQAHFRILAEKRRDHYERMEVRQSEALVTVQTNINDFLKSSNSVMIRRALRVRDACHGHETVFAGITKTSEAFKRIEVDKTRNYLYCPILKTGSTFFSRALYALRRGGKITNPYRIPIERSLRDRDKRVLRDFLPLKDNTTQEFLSGSMSFMFVREPFARLLSGYMDKLFAPNPYFWREVGQHVVSTYRSRAKVLRRSRLCGEDVTFTEFVRYVIDSEINTDLKIAKYRDLHFTPAYDQCKVCALNYTLVGKMETFSNDMPAIVQQLGTDLTKTQATKWSKDATLDAIQDTVHSPFGWKKAIKRCMTWQEAMRRIWRKLQSRAIIPLEDKFPFSKDNNITSTKFVVEVVKRHEAADKERLKRQKKEILAMAYSAVDRNLVQKLTEVFRLDFELFEYDDRPDFIFGTDFVRSVDSRSSIFNVSSI